MSGPATHRHRLALLALLAASGTMTRAKLMATLWPDSSEAHARSLLNQAVHVLRQTLGREALVATGGELGLGREVVDSDTAAFEESFAANEFERAVGLYSGPFLDGFFLPDAWEFGEWVERERGRLAGDYAKALEALAEAAEKGGDILGATEWWTARARCDPYDSRVALRLLRALAASGNRGGALELAAAHERRLRDGYGVAPPAEVTDFVDWLRSPEGAEAGRTAAVAPTEITPERKVGSSVPVPAAVPAPASKRPVPYWALAAGLALVLPGSLWVFAPRGDTPAAAPGAETVAAEDIAQAVADELDRRIVESGAGGSARQQTSSIAAQELYVRGRDPALFRSEAGAREALSYFEQAVALDSAYAAAHAGVGLAHYRLTESSGARAQRTELLYRAEEAALRAIALDDSLPEGHAVLGLVHTKNLDFASAETHFLRAIELEPAGASWYEWLVSHYLWAMRSDAALTTAERAVALDPRSPATQAELARALAANGRCDEALARLEPLQEVSPPLLRVGPVAAQCLAQQGMWDEALSELRVSWEERGERGHALFANLLLQAGQREEALRMREEMLESWENGSGDAVALAIISLGLGDLDAAFSWLDEAIEERSLAGQGPAIMEPVFESLRADPRFEELRNRLGL